jgi:protein-disulfide isomerase
MNKFLFNFALVVGFCLILFSNALSQEQSGASPVWSKGTLNSKVTIEVFQDLECPACAYYYSTLEQIEKNYGDKVLIIFRHFPLRKIHPNALAAAQAVEAAGMQGKFWEMLRVIYENQKDLSYKENPKELFAKYAGKLGLNKKKFRIDYDSKSVIQRIQLDMIRGNSLRIMATPSLFLNGESIEFAQMELKSLSSLIEEKLKN